MSAAAADRADRYASDYQHQPLLFDQHQDLSRARAESHTDSDLGSSLSYDVGHYAIETERREKDCGARKEREQDQGKRRCATLWPRISVIGSMA